MSPPWPTLAAVPALEHRREKKVEKKQALLHSGPVTCRPTRKPAPSFSAAIGAPCRLLLCPLPPLPTTPLADKTTTSTTKTRTTSRRPRSIYPTCLAAVGLGASARLPAPPSSFCLPVEGLTAGCFFHSLCSSSDRPILSSSRPEANGPSSSCNPLSVPDPGQLGAVELGSI